MKPARLMICTAAFAVLSTSYASAKTGYAITTVNLRSGPATTNDIVTKIPGGSRIEVNACTNGWCEVTYQGKSGFAIETALDTSGRVRRASPSYYAGGYYPGGYYAGGPIYTAPPAYYYGPPAYYYGPGPYYYRPYWRPRWRYY